MFGGIIEIKGRIEEFNQSATGGAILTLKAGKLSSRLRIGDSISVDGICLTVARKKRSSIALDISAETIASTNIARRVIGDEVNLELPVTPATFLSGHFVQGHVEGTGTVEKWIKKGDDVRLFIRIPRELSSFCVRKGSIAINGVSLTIASRQDTLISIALIPYTLRNTNLSRLAQGDRVNIETDVIGRYVVATIKNNYDQKKIKHQRSKIKKSARRSRI